LEIMRAIAKTMASPRAACLALLRTARYDLDEGHLSHGLPVAKKAASVAHSAQYPNFEIEAELLERAIPRAGLLRQQERPYMDKFAECGLTAQPGRTLDTPVVAQAWMHIECRVMMTANMAPELFADGKAEDFYPNGDFHTLFLGEVVDFYET
jgi:hypothetical protein